MNWWRVLAAMGLPSLVAVPVSLLFWARRQMIIGTAAGTGLFLCGAIVFGGLEYVAGIRFRIWCELTGTICGPSEPSDFVRISVYGFIAMVQVMALYVIAGSVERRLTESQHDSTWRR